VRNSHSSKSDRSRALFHHRELAGLGLSAMATAVPSPSPKPPS
jgi:hypothetical protein